MAFLFYIDGQLTDQPDNDMQVETLITRDEQLQAQIITQELRIQYSGENNLTTGTISGYTYLKNLFDSGVCQEAELEIYDQVGPTTTRLIHKGVIKIPQMEVQEQEPLLRCAIQDNSLYSYVLNNRDLKVDFRAVKSKNGETITPLSIYSLDLFDSATGVFGSSIGAYYEGYRIIEVIEFIISIISDGKIGFRSAYFAGMEPEPFLIKGQAILNPYTIYPNAQQVEYQVSFAEWFAELNPCKNLSFYIDNTDPLNPVFVLENTEATYNNTLIHTFTEPKNIRTTVNTKNLYGTVNTGSNVLADGQDDINLYPWNEATSYFGWKRESFYPLGQCNTRAELNLVNNWVLSNNVIQEIVYGQSDGYNDLYFLIECEQVDPNALTAIAYRYTYFGQTAPPYFYNFGLNNFNKLKRHSDKFEQSFGTFLGNGGGKFRALKGDSNLQDTSYVTAPASDPNFIPIGGLTVAAAYVNETTLGGFDDGGNWNNSTSEYTVPSSGDYSFTHHIDSEIDGFVSMEQFDLLSVIQLYDSVGNFKAQDFQGQSYGNGWQVGNGFHSFDHTWVFNAAATDIVVAQYVIVYSPNQAGNQNNPRTMTILYSSYLECNGSPDTGIAIVNGNLQIKKYIHEFEYEINETDWQNIIANPTGLIEFVKDSNSRFGHILEMRHNHQTGFTRNKLITSSTENASA